MLDKALVENDVYGLAYLCIGSYVPASSNLHTKLRNRAMMVDLSLRTAGSFIVSPEIQKGQTHRFPLRSFAILIQTAPYSMQHIVISVTRDL